MKRILLTSAAVALFSATTASACLVDSDGQFVAHSDGPTVLTGLGGACTLDSSVLFSVNSAVLTAKGKAVLDTINASRITTVTGYASVEGDAAANLALSRARAQAVANYLGIDAKIVAGGETNQFGDTLAANRVVVLS